MSIHILSKTTTLHASEEQNSLGETALPFAPKVCMPNGVVAVPQQYLNVTRTLKNTEEILCRIEFSDHYPLFTGELNGVLYIQAGIIGEENYPKRRAASPVTKIVYGRRWMIDPAAPTSEVVQTALLAIKKAREHEIREKLVVKINSGRNRATPFNSHMDLPLMVGSSKELWCDGASDIDIVERLNLGSLSLSLDNKVELSNGHYLIQINLAGTHQPENNFNDLKNTKISFVSESSSNSDVLHALMNELIYRSDRFIEENFKFDEFARFSHKLCPIKVAQFSYQTRNIKHKDERFNDHFKDMSYRLDSSKAPNYANGKLGKKQYNVIATNNVKEGYLPGRLEVDRLVMNKGSSSTSVKP